MSGSQDVPAEPAPGAGWFVTFITTLPGILTATAAVIAAIGTAFYGGTKVGEREASPPSVTPTVTKTVTLAPPASNAPTTEPSSGGATPTPGGSSGGGQPSGQSFLSARQTVGTGGTNVSAGPVQILTEQYQNSIRFSCGGNATTVTYEVSGFAFLDATVGVPSDATQAAGRIATMSFLKDGSATQLTPPVQVTVGAPAKIHLPLQGSTQLQFSCIGKNSTGGFDSVDVALGSAVLIPS